MAKSDSSEDTPKATVEFCPICHAPGAELEYVTTEHRSVLVGGDHDYAVETFNIFSCPTCSGTHEEYVHELSNVEGPTQSVVIRTEPTLRAAAE